MDKAKRAEEIAVEILEYSRNELLVALRFMDLALCKLAYRRDEAVRIATDGNFLYYSPMHVFELYKTGNGELNHSYLHLIFHCIFYHPFVSADIDREVWDLACDIAVEGVLSELDIRQIECLRTALIEQKIAELKEEHELLTAERLYRSFLSAKISRDEIAKLNKVFHFDDHYIWYMEDELTEKTPAASASADTIEPSDPDETDEGEDLKSQWEITFDIPTTAKVTQGDGGSDDAVKSEWQRISERVKVDLETASKEWGDKSANLIQNLTEVNRETYDYTEFLQKFSVMGEEMQINDDEFDYPYYNYGLQLYGNVPLIEPLEYKEVKKVKDFVIAIDTSGSVQGELVERFITKTYNILSLQESFFTRINVHIIQCDMAVQKDDKITSRREFDDYIKDIHIYGFGGTDFRPVFEYVDELLLQGEFTDLKGLIYFTDGYGFFPKKIPEYETAFVFIDDDYSHPDVPVWAIKLVLPREQLYD